MNTHLGSITVEVLMCCQNEDHA